MKNLIHPMLHDLSLAGVLYALGDPVRLQIVRCLARTEAACCASLTNDLPKSTLTRHFRVLRENGVIAQEIRGRRFLNSLRRTDLEARFPGLLDAILSASELHDAENVLSNAAPAATKRVATKRVATKRVATKRVATKRAATKRAAKSSIQKT